MLQGYKTYIVGIIGLLWAAAGLWGHVLDLAGASEIAMMSLAAMGLRGGVSTEIRLVLAALGIKLPEDPTTAKLSQVKEAVRKAEPVARRIAPVFALLLLGLLPLAACAPGSFFDNPANDLQIARSGFAAAQALYNTVCATNADAEFCSPSNMQKANDAARLAQNLLKNAQAILANANSTDGQVAAAIKAAQDAILDFSNFVNDLSAEKQKALQAKAAARISLWDGLKGWLAAPWRG